MIDERRFQFIKESVFGWWGHRISKRRMEGLLYAVGSRESASLYWLTLTVGEPLRIIVNDQLYLPFPLVARLVWQRNERSVEMGGLIV